MPQCTILYVHSSDEMYGADLILLQLVEHLALRRFRPIVVLPTDVAYDGRLTTALRERNIKTVHLKTAILRRKYLTPWGSAIYLWRLVMSTVSLVRLIRVESVDIVHSNTTAVTPGALAAWLTGKPHIWHVHEIIVHPRILWRLTSWLLPRLSNRVVAVSEAVCDHLCAGDRFNEKKSIVIHNGIDLKRFANLGGGRRVRDEWKVAPEQLLIGMVGRISHWKGQDYFLEVASLVSKNHPEAHFAIVGTTFPGQEKLIDHLKLLSADLGLSAVVTFAGYRSDIPAVLDALDVFVLPSTLPDPFPTVLLEAMATCKPVVANAHGGSIEIIEHEVTGLLVRPDSPEEMAAAINRLLDKPSQRLAMGQRGRERLISAFSLESYVANWQKLYENLVCAN
jgi:glycosyltransferase involved in cell wall biosynthesis